MLCLDNNSSQQKNVEGRIGSKRFFCPALTRQKELGYAISPQDSKRAMVNKVHFPWFPRSPATPTIEKLLYGEFRNSAPPKKWRPKAGISTCGIMMSTAQAHYKQAKSLFFEGKSLVEISRELPVSYSTMKPWKKVEKWAVLRDIVMFSGFQAAEMCAIA